MIHTTNPIDVNIRLQITLIEVYLIGFFFNVRSALKGRIRLICAMIHDQSCLNLIEIESKTQGYHEELNILLKNHLISSQFNQEFGLQMKNISFYRKFHPKNREPSDSLKDDSMAEIAQFKWATIP